MRTDPEGTGDGDPAMVAVWDPFVRVFHWCLVTSFAVAWLSSAQWDALHEWFGYAAALLVAFRLFWGFLGTRHARFSDFVYSPSAVVSYLKEVLAKREPRYLGHNPAGGAMILALLAAMAATALTGWLETTDAYFGVAWVQDTHSYLAHAILVLAAFHVGGVAVTSLRHRENLVRAMITGLKKTR